MTDGDWERLSGMTLPPVLLLVLPDSDAAWEAGVDLARAACNGERSRWHEFAALSSPAAREVVRLSTYRWDHDHIMVVRLDTAPGPSVLDILLKTLEEPPAGVRFILTLEAGFQVPATIVSRASQVYRAGVDPASVAEAMEPARQLVIQAVHAASEGDQTKLARASRDWTPVSSLLLGVWAAEVYTRRWGVFSLSDACGYTPADAMRVAAAMAAYEGSAGRLAMRAALGSLPPR